MLENIFITILNMSITASIAAVLIIFFRLIFGRKLPKSFNYVLWAIILIRLVIPFSLSSTFSIFNAISVPETIITQSPEYNEKDYSFVNKTDYKSTSQEQNEYDVKSIDNSIVTITPVVSADPIKTITSVISWIWLCGVVGLILISLFAYLSASRRLKEAVLYKHNDLVHQCSKRLKLNRKIQIYTSDRINTPVVYGLLKAHIILPKDIVYSCSELELKHIITHELVHIKRYDYLIKPLAVLTLCIHWFNPVMWLCFMLFQKDMEMSCDARVLSVNDEDIRSEYAKSLVNISVRQNVLLNGGLLAFGENNIKSRIKGIMKFKKTKVWTAVIAITILIVISFVLLTNGQNGGTDSIAKGDNNSPIISVNNEVFLLLKHKSKNIGDVSDVKSLLKELTYGNRIDEIALKTDIRPYGITINYKLEDVDDQIHNVKPVLIDNALIIFSLIENVETINFNIISEDTYEFYYTRDEMQQYFDKDLWSYSDDEKAFYEYIMDISFEILVYPEKYSPLMSFAPGMRIDISLNAAYYNFDKVEYTAKDNTLHTWNSGVVSEASKTISFGYGPVYWSPLNMTNEEDTITISILDKGNIIAKKQISIIKDGDYYRVKPSYDILTDNFYEEPNNN